MTIETKPREDLSLKLATGRAAALHLIPLMTYVWFILEFIRV